jgi:hypothetical protein
MLCYITYTVAKVTLNNTIITVIAIANHVERKWPNIKHQALK